MLTINRLGVPRRTLVYFIYFIEIREKNLTLTIFLNLQLGK